MKLEVVSSTPYDHREDHHPLILGPGYVHEALGIALQDQQNDTF
jgi:hypothetical protein